MVFSIRTRLTFWYTTLLTLSLLAFGLFFSYSLSTVFVNRIDRQISSVANMMVHTFVKPSGLILLPRDFDIILERFFGIPTSGLYIQVLDPNAHVIAKSSKLERFQLPISREAYRSALEGQSSFQEYRQVGRYPIRLISKPIFIKGRGLVAIVQVGASLEVMQEVSHSLFYFFTIGAVVAVVAASLGGWFLARQALKPVEKITDTARRIGAENLNERMDISGPNDELRALAETFNRMIERLEDSFLQIKQFTADASHELKTPLTIMKGEMEIALRSKGEPGQMKEALESSLEEIDRMSYIVRNLLDLAKIGVEKEVEQVAVPLDNVLTDRFEHFRRLALDRGVELDILRNEPALVTGDPVRVSQLVFNLIDNAIKYTREGGRVTLSLGTEDGRKPRAVLAVSDTGIGIASEDLPHLFDRFYRVDKARTRDAGGAGLGLSICKEIVDSMGGAIDVKSEPGEGTAFTVRLPLTKDTA